ncbi:selenite/tellurite reduction operon c-type cytochrome lipoprotein ExtS [Geotalea sp. SG265]|uniref:selenite/tellurite reduction operon c-type cytochrome lipoprotein ExtS n=1 Tax=Geotalea sp. SG265 TaxID=2922867 RepID=UPI001FAFDFB0|nr:selenite/tellurite reduction operon c-type cytochrome lipoprotein ExtS [Geotalea sp. SG265]
MAAQRSVCLSCHPVHHGDCGNCTGCHRGNDRSERKNIAHAGLIGGYYAHFTIPGSPIVAEGKKLIDAAGCRRCHRTGGKGNGLASDLDRFFLEASPKEIASAIKEPVLYMPHFRFTDGQLTALVNAVAEGSRQEAEPRGETVRVVHFADKNLENSFVKRCGSCHKLLSEAYGGLGSGRIGPNLSGIFSEFYPVTFSGKERWNEVNLKRWLKNPRMVRPNALMPPVPVSAAEFRQLLDALVVSRRGKGPLRK